MKNTIVNFAGHACRPLFSTYKNRPDMICIRLVDENNTPIATATVNSPNLKLPNNCVAIKTYNENSDMDKALIQAGIIEPELVDMLPFGHIDVPVYRLTEAFRSTEGAQAAPAR